MALDSTYAGLQASIGDWLNRTDLFQVIPDMIHMAEAQMNRDIRCADMIATTTLTLNAASVALPSDFNGMVSIELPAGNNPLRYEKPDGIRALRQLYSSAGTPFAWSVMGTNIETVPAPSGSFACPISYYQRIPSLTSSNTTNWLLTKHPEAYLYGALMQAAYYLKDDARFQTVAPLYAKAIADILGSDARVSFGHGLGAPYRSAAAPVGTDPQPAPAPAFPGQ